VVAGGAARELLDAAVGGGLEDEVGGVGGVAGEGEGRVEVTRAAGGVDDEDLLAAGDDEVLHVQEGRGAEARGAGEAEDDGLVALAGLGVEEELEVLLRRALAVELGRAEDVVELDGDVEEPLLGAAHDGQVEADGDVAVGPAGDLAGERRAARCGVDIFNTRGEGRRARLDAVDDEGDGVRVLALVRVARADVAEGARAVAVSGRGDLLGPHRVATVVGDRHGVGHVGDAGQGQRRRRDVDAGALRRRGAGIGSTGGEGQEQRAAEDGDGWNLLHRNNPDPAGRGPTGCAFL